MFRFISDIIEIKNSLLELIREVKSISTDRGYFERNKQDEIQRLERLHEREIAFYKEQLEEQKTLAERLLRISGIDTIEKLNQLDKPVVAKETEPEETQIAPSSSPLGSIIARDKKKEWERQQKQQEIAFHATSVAQEILANVFAEQQAKQTSNGNGNSHNYQTAETGNENINVDE